MGAYGLFLADNFGTSCAKHAPRSFLCVVWFLIGLAFGIVFEMEDAFVITPCVLFAPVHHGPVVTSDNVHARKFSNTRVEMEFIISH